MKKTPIIKTRKRFLTGMLAAILGSALGTVSAAASPLYSSGIIRLADDMPGSFSHYSSGGWKTGTEDANYDIGKDPTISKDTIDRGKTGSITIYKLNDENGRTFEGDGMYHASFGDDAASRRDGIPNIVFSTAKIADLVHVSGRRSQNLSVIQDHPGSDDRSVYGETGVYYSNLDYGFSEVARKCGIKVTDYATVIDGSLYWSAEQMEVILERIKDANGDQNTWTGETLLNQYIENAALLSAGTKIRNGNGLVPHPTTKGKDFAATGAQLSEEDRTVYYNGETGLLSPINPEKGKTVMTDLDLGLYVVAETGYFSYTGIEENGNKLYEKVYRDYIYDADGDEKPNTGETFQKQSNNGAAVNSRKEVTSSDLNFNDDTDIEQEHARNAASQRYAADGDVQAGGGDFTDAEDGTQNPYVIYNPCSPFLVSLPQTNLADLVKAEKGSGNTVTYGAGTVWQYDMNVYPKNNMTSIAKKVVADDGDTLTERQDYHIGQNIHQIIYADVPVPMYLKENGESRRNREFRISDTMSSGLTLQKVTRVALRGKIARPEKLSQFDTRESDASDAALYATNMELEPGKDYVITCTTGNADAAEAVHLTNDADSCFTPDGTVANGNENVHGFTVSLTDEGLRKLDNLKVASQVIVEFDCTLNQNAVIGSMDGRTFNTNRPTLAWRNQNTLLREIEGNPVHIFTYELDVTKLGKSADGTRDIHGNSISDAHSFDAADVTFTVQQEKQYDPDPATNGSVETDLAYVFFVQDRDADGHLIDGSYHVWSPADGAIEEIISADRGSIRGSALEQEEGYAYDLHLTKTEGKLCLTTTGTTPSRTCVVTQLVSPSHSGTAASDTGTPDHSGAGTGGNTDKSSARGMLRLRGLDSESYLITEKSTSSHFNLLKNRFRITLNSTQPKDGNLLPNAAESNQPVSSYGAALTIDDGTVFAKNRKAVPLSHKSGIASVLVENYRTITLHTGGKGTWFFYVISGCLAGTAYLIVRKKKHPRKHSVYRLPQKGK
ncbi:MAG: hypothetical protein ACI4ET_03980 [Bilifractor sp.]